MNEVATDSLTQRLAVLERRVRWSKFFEIALLAIMILILWATLTRVAEEIRARRFVIVDADNKELLDMRAAGNRLPAVTLYDVNGHPRTQLDLLPDGSPRLYFADADQRIRLRLGAGTEGRSPIEVIDSKARSFGNCRLHESPVDENIGLTRT
jgi:hypothetical protein